MANTTDPNFLEVESKEEANKIDMDGKYSFVTFSEKRGYIFKKRQR